MSGLISGGASAPDVPGDAQVGMPPPTYEYPVILPPSVGTSKLLFLHHMKAGGTTFDKVCRAFYRADECCPERYDLVEQWPRSALAKYKYFSFHGSLKSAASIREPIRIISIFRHPISRLASQIDFFSQYSDHAIERDNLRIPRLVKALGPAAYLRSTQVAVLQGFWNPYAQALGGDLHFSPSGRPWRDQAELLECALMNLEMLSVVGISEHMHQTCALACAKVGIMNTFTGATDNKTSANYAHNSDFEPDWSPVVLSAECHELMDKVTGLDAVIYERASEIFRANVNTPFTLVDDLGTLAGVPRNGFAGPEIHSEGQDGYLLFGPGVRLPPGIYCVEFFVDFIDVPPGGSDLSSQIVFDVVDRCGTRILASLAIKLDEGRPLGTHIVTLYFQLPLVANDVEFRVQCIAYPPVVVRRRVKLGSGAGMVGPSLHPARVDELNWVNF